MRYNSQFCLCGRETPLSSKYDWNLSPARAILSFAEESSKECEDLVTAVSHTTGPHLGRYGVFANLQLWAFGHRGEPIAYVRLIGGARFF